ncbi:MAG: rhodanese-like domain-containing protein [Burkholderiaceae bacterium]|nr:rhodanese-like domain-containing protein [Burkholderiaceae bacterium]
MQFLLDNWYLVLMAVASGAALLWTTLGKGGGGVAAAEAVQLINREKGVLIDVSEPAEYANGHAAGAKNVPFGQLEGAKALPANKTLPVILMCPSGARAGRAAALLRKAGHERAVALSGGTAAWREAGLPMDKGA